MSGVTQEVSGVVSHSYQGTDETQITAAQGETVSVLGDYGDGWCEVRVRGKQGIFPTAYLSFKDGQPRKIVEGDVGELPEFEDNRRASVLIDVSEDEDNEDREEVAGFQQLHGFNFEEDPTWAGFEDTVFIESDQLRLEEEEEWNRRIPRRTEDQEETSVMANGNPSATVQESAETEVVNATTMKEVDYLSLSKKSLQPTSSDSETKKQRNSVETKTAGDHEMMLPLESPVAETNIIISEDEDLQEQQNGIDTDFEFEEVGKVGLLDQKMSSKKQVVSDMMYEPLSVVNSTKSEGSSLTDSSELLQTDAASQSEKSALQAKVNHLESELKGTREHLKGRLAEVFSLQEEAALLKSRNAENERRLQGWLQTEKSSESAQSVMETQLETAKRELQSQREFYEKREKSLQGAMTKKLQGVEARFKELQKSYSAQMHQRESKIKEQCKQKIREYLSKERERHSSKETKAGTALQKTQVANKALFETVSRQKDSLNMLASEKATLVGQRKVLEEKVEKLLKKLGAVEQDNRKAVMMGEKLKISSEHNRQLKAKLAKAKVFFEKARAEFSQKKLELKVLQRKNEKLQVVLRQVVANAKGNRQQPVEIKPVKVDRSHAAPVMQSAGGEKSTKNGERVEKKRAAPKSRSRPLAPTTSHVTFSDPFAELNL